MALNSHGLNLMGDYPMKLSHLLTGAALVALTAGAAQAQVPNAFVQVGNFDGAAADEDFGATQKFASEVALATTKPNGELEFRVDARTAGTGGTGLFDGLGASDKATITIALSGGLYFDAQIVDADFVNTSASGCDFNLQSGGAAGSQSATFVSASNTALCDVNVNDMVFDFEIEVQGAGNFTTTISGPNGQLYSEVYDGSPTTVAAPALVTVGTGVTVAVAADTTATEADNATSAAGIRFDTLDGGGDNVLGTISFADTGAIVDFGAAGPANNTDFDLGTHATGASFSVTLPSKAGFTGVRFAGGANADITFPTSSNTATATIAASALVLGDLNDTDTITVSLLGDAVDGVAIAFQNPTMSASFTGATNVDLSGKAVSNAALQTITLEDTATTADTFKWVGDGGAGTASIFRCDITGSTSPRVSAIVTNATATGGGTFDLGTLSAPGGELIVDNVAIGSAAGPYVRADVQLAVTAPATGISCDRMLLSGSGTLSDFGDDNN
ncbi:hypothetical protein [Marinicauda pacifica]|uniref:hypothetical protein n=1 Tax=Marinicauda pacifica TaxID=1133559 RepID=UPI0035C838B6